MQAEWVTDIEFQEGGSDMAVVEAPLQTPGTAADIGQGQPDPRALAVAQETQS